MAVSGSILGNPVQRVEDPRFLRGEALYVDDLTPPQTVHVAFVRSSMAHARLLAVDTGDAERSAGVLLVATHHTLGLAPVQGFVMLPPAFNRPPLAAMTSNAFRPILPVDPKTATFFAAADHPSH